MYTTIIGVVKTNSRRCKCSISLLVWLQLKQNSELDDMNYLLANIVVSNGFLILWHWSSAFYWVYKIEVGQLFVSQKMHKSPLLAKPQLSSCKKSFDLVETLISNCVQSLRCLFVYKLYPSMGIIIFLSTVFLIITMIRKKCPTNKCPTQAKHGLWMTRQK